MVDLCKWSSVTIYTQPSDADRSCHSKVRKIKPNMEDVEMSASDVQILRLHMRAFLGNKLA